LVQRGQSADGRERPWRSSSTGLEFGPTKTEASRSSSAAARAVDELALARDEELTRDALARHDTQPTEWRAAEAHNSYALRITPRELAQLVSDVDRLVRPYIGLTRTEAPDDADVAYLRLLAFRHPEAG
jgi:hypothetical protein